MSANDPHLTDAISRAAEMIARADGILIAAGAGMGVDSGLPDFRGREGFWRAYPALARAGIDFTQAACPDAFDEHPRRAWGFYGHRLALYRRTAPHAGFTLLRAWAAAKPHGGTVFTSNVDGQFQRAGFHADDIHECHGSIHHLQCTRPCSMAIWPADDYMPRVDEEQCLLLDEPPTCPRCGALARPNILMFGDGRWIADRSDAQARRQRAWLRNHTGRLVVIEIGAGTAVPSVRHFSAALQSQLGADLVRINLREPEVSGRAVGLPLRGLDALERIGHALRQG